MKSLILSAIALFFFSVGFSAEIQDQVLRGFEKVKIERSRLRGLCVTKDYVILGVIDSKNNGQGTVYIFNRKGEKVREIVGNTVFFGHGAASDNRSVWTSDYFDNRTIYEYDIKSGKLLSRFSVKEGNPIRMKYDPDSGLIWITYYDQPFIFAYDRAGNPRYMYFIKKGGNNAAISPVKGGFYVLFSPANTESNKRLYYYDRFGELKGEKKLDWGWWDIDVLDGSIYYDNEEGQICSAGLPPMDAPVPIENKSEY